MQPFPTARRANPLGGGPLDRVSGKRDDAAFVAGALASADSLFVTVWRDKTLVRERRAVFLAPGARLGGEAWALLGLRDERAVIADFVDGEAPPATAAGAFEDLRAVGAALPGDEAAILAHARGLAMWRAKHRFCGICGGATEPERAGNQLRCARCGAQHFPRTDPAVIMAVIHPDGDHLLMGRAPRFPDGMVSTLAGFVEPGESMEDAVRREVLEEAGVRVGDVGYHSSQPWPFPASVMLGFYARAVTTEIVIDPEELAFARWVSRAELADPAAHGFSLPPRLSIARHLIEDFVA